MRSRMTLAVLANKPDDARKAFLPSCVTAMTKELMGVVSRYDLMDFRSWLLPCGHRNLAGVPAG